MSNCRKCIVFAVDEFTRRTEDHLHRTAITHLPNDSNPKGDFMKRQLLAVLFVLALSSLALGQSALPIPNIVDHQTSSDFGGASYQFTEDIASAYNILILVVTCDWTHYTGGGGPQDGCGATGASLPSDSNGNVFTPIEHHANTANKWAEEDYYVIVSQTGTDTITFTPVMTCTPSCTFKAMIQQVQGIGADN